VLQFAGFFFAPELAKYNPGAGKLVREILHCYVFGQRDGSWQKFERA